MVGPSDSRSMEERKSSRTAAMAESRRSSSGGRFNGCESRSYENRADADAAGSLLAFPLLRFFLVVLLLRLGDGGFSGAVEERWNVGLYSLRLFDDDDDGSTGCFRGLVVEDRER